MISLHINTYHYLPKSSETGPFCRTMYTPIPYSTAFHNLFENKSDFEKLNTNSKAELSNGVVVPLFKEQDECLL